MEYSTGWPVDARTKAAIATAREDDWSAGLTAAGGVEKKAQVIELTGLLRNGPDEDQLKGWPTDLRVIARRVPRDVGEQAELGEDPNWRYGAFATNTVSGQVQYLDGRHRTQAHVEDRIKESSRRAVPVASRRSLTHETVRGSTWPGTPSASWPGCAYSPWMATSHWPNPRPYGSGCWPPPPATCATPANGS